MPEIYIYLCRFRTSNHSLPMEKGRWYHLDRSERKCCIYQNIGIGDEYHYSFILFPMMKKIKGKKIETKADTVFLNSTCSKHSLTCLTSKSLGQSDSFSTSYDVSTVKFLLLLNQNCKFLNTQTISLNWFMYLYFVFIFF